MTLDQELRNGFIVQCRVIAALMLREVHTINGNSKLGYLWVLVQSAFSIAVFWGLREFMNAHAPHGMSMALFLALGFGVWAVFSDGVTKTMSAVSGNRALLTFPQVTEFDVMFARILVLSATQLVVTAIIVAVSLLFGYVFRPGDWLLALAVMILIPLCALGMGMIIAALAVFVPVLEKIVPMIFRILFFVSGVFFSVDMFPQYIAEILMWNPILQAIELMRTSLHQGYTVTGLSFGYLVIFTVCSLGLGGFLERYVRSRRVDQ
jgi:capsular polysaccharide transport system permease protein